MTKIQVSVIVCTYNREEYIEKNLKSLAQQSSSPQNYEIIIIDNHSTDNTESICNTFINEHPELQIKYVKELNPGLSFARNRGIREAKGKYLSFIDDDAFVDHHFIGNLSGFFSENPGIAVIGGKIVPIYEDKEPKWMSGYLLPLVAGLDLGNSAREFPRSKYPIGANMAFRREIFDELGEFNTELGRKGENLEGSEEKDMIYRIRETGKKVWYVPQVAVQHVIPAKRTSLEHIRKQAIGVGKSEKKRLQSASISAKSRKIVSEIVKIIGTFVLAFYFLFQFEYNKSVMLIKFRFWVISGYLHHA